MTDTTENLDALEIWEATTKSTVWLWLIDTIAGNGSWKHVKIGGEHGLRRVQLTTRERRHNQDLITSANSAAHDPFTNGKLTCRQGPIQSPRGFTDDQLIQLLGLPTEHDETFEKVIDDFLPYEVLIRRVLALAERHAPAYRRDLIEEKVDERYRIGSTQRSLRDDLPEKGVGNGVLISS